MEALNDRAWAAPESARSRAGLELGEQWYGRLLGLRAELLQLCGHLDVWRLNAERERTIGEKVESLQAKVEEIAKLTGVRAPRGALAAALNAQAKARGDPRPEMEEAALAFVEAYEHLRIASREVAKNARQLLDELRPHIVSLPRLVARHRGKARPRTFDPKTPEEFVTWPGYFVPRAIFLQEALRRWPDVPTGAAAWSYFGIACGMDVAPATREEWAKLRAGWATEIKRARREIAKAGT